MATAINATNVSKALKIRYSTPNVRRMLFENSPLIAMLRKDMNFDGESRNVPVQYGMPQSTSPNFSTAQTLSTSSTSGTPKITQFVMTRTKNYSVVTLDREFMLSTKGNKGAFWNMLTMLTDMKLNQLGRDLSTNIYRSGFGAVATIGSISTNDITLANPADAHSFEVGAQYQASASESGHVLLDSGDSIEVQAVNHETGVITFTTAVATTISGLAAGNVLFRRGSREDSATPTRLLMAGLLDWLPNDMPSSTPFFGVNRSTTNRLGGLRYDGRSDGVYDALVKGCEIARQNGAKPGVCLINPVKKTEFTTAGASFETFRQVVDSEAQIGVSGIVIKTPSGPGKVVEDPDCPSTNAFLLDMSTWTLGSLGNCPHIFDDDAMMIRQSGDDGYELRAGDYGNLWCNAPGRNVNVRLG